MNVTLVRNATVVVKVGGRRILVDPMFDPASARPPIENTANPVDNPTVELPLSVEQIVSGLDGVIVTHRHKDHLDDTAVRLLPHELPVLCQPEDEDALRELGFDARAVETSVDWDGLVVHRVPARHGFGEVAEALAPVSGFV